MKVKKTSLRQAGIDQADSLNSDQWPYTRALELRQDDQRMLPRAQVQSESQEKSITLAPTQSSLSLLAGSASVTLDESGGLQNAQTSAGTAQDADDNDIGWAALPSAFATRLSSLWSGHTPINAALSGYNGSNSGENIVSIQNSWGGAVTTSFSDAAGHALDGDASGLKTTAGVDLFLWTDSTDSNIVLARKGVWVTDHYAADPAGDIVFAGYLEQTGTPVSGARMWTVQYESLFNPDAANPDDPVDLTNHLWVSVSQGREFSLQGIPSGQNLFLMIGDSQAAVVITGEKPANQSQGYKVTDGDTVNTSQVNGGSIATNNQLISPPSGKLPGEGMYFTFVTGANPNYTAPNLDETEADVEANIAFTGLYLQSAASFRISQITPGTSATLKVSAYNTALETGTGFVDGLGDSDDVRVNVTSVHVYTVVGTTRVAVTDPDLHILDNGDGTWTVQGVKANYVIAYETAVGHSRLLVQNIGSTESKYNASFDIGGFGFTESQTQTQEIGSHVRFEDDAPTVDPSLTAVSALTVDDSDFDANASASFASLFSVNFHNDGFKDSDHNGVQDTDALTYSLGVSGPDADSGLVDTLTGQAVLLNKVGDVVIGSAAGHEVFRITVNAQTGLVTLDQSRAVMHDDPLDPDEAGHSAAHLTSADLVTLTATATDGDLDTDTATRNIGDAFRFKDDGPTVDPSLTAVSALTVDDSDFDANASASFASLFTVNFHNDGFKDSDHNGVQDTDALTYSLGVSAPNADSGLLDTLTGLNVLLSMDGDDVVGTAGGLEVLRITVDAQTGVVTLDQSRAVMHDDPLDPDEAGASAASFVSAGLVTLSAIATDGDLDTDTTTRSIGDAFRFKDDGPTFNYITNLVGFNVQYPLIGFDAITQGNDTAGVFMSSLSGRVDGHDITNAQVTLKEDTADQVFYTFSFDYLPGPNSTVVQTATGIVTVNKAEGTFFFDIDEPIKGETTYSTSAPEATFNYDRLGNKSPEIVVQQYDDHFFGVLTARSAEPPSDTNDLLAGGDHVFTPGEIFDSASEAYLNIATSTVGANSDTMQAGELLNFDFYAVNPVLGTVSPPKDSGASVDPAAQRACASQVNITLDQINVGQEDIAIVLKLYNADTDTSTTRLLLANAASDYVLDPATGYRVVSIGKDDYDSAHYQISGLQVLSSTEEVTGTGYSLSTHEAVTLTAAGRGLADSSDTDVFKIIQIDIQTEQTATFDTDLVFAGQVVDGDLDAKPFTFKVHLEADSNILSAPGSMDALNGTPGADIFEVIQGTSSLDLKDAQYILGYTNNFQTQLDTLKLGLAGDATADTGNYVEAAAAVADYTAALAAANLALAALNGTSSQSQLYAFEYDASNGYLFEDTNSDGAADQVVVLVGIDKDGLNAADIVV